jgi:sRNA-binding protein
MEVSGKTIRFPNTLWVQHGGVKVKNEGGLVALEGIDEDSYLKIFNHFGRVLKLYTFENDQWVDAATGAAPTTLDESVAGHVAATQHKSSMKQAAAKAGRPRTAAKKKPAAKPAARKSTTSRTTKSTRPKTTAKKPAGKPAAKGKSNPAKPKAKA